MDELIEALRDAASRPYDMRDVQGRADLMERAAAALEAAREDVARMEWLEQADYSSVGDGGISGAQITVYLPDSDGEWHSGPTVRAAIDQARGKGGCGEGVGGG